MILMSTTTEMCLLSEPVAKRQEGPGSARLGVELNESKEIYTKSVMESFCQTEKNEKPNKNIKNNNDFMICSGQKYCIATGISDNCISL